MICRVCDSENLEKVIDLGLQPWCNNFLKPEQVGKEPFYPLEVYYCKDCTTAQLGYTVAKEVMFGDHTYLSGITASLSKHFERIAVDVDSRFFSNKNDKRICDIGSNDGTQLKHYQNLGYEVLGIESSKTTAQIANNQGINTRNDFFSLELAKKLTGKFDVINASGVFFHLEELHSVCEGIKFLLKDDGVFVVQFLYMKNIIENCAFDQIYHEHLLYYTLKSIQILLERHNLQMFDAYIEPIHGGSVIGFVSHKGQRDFSARYKDLLQVESKSKINEIETYYDFFARIKKMKEHNLSYIKSAIEGGKIIYGMGAPVKGNTLLNYFGITKSQITYLVEKNPLRKGLIAPGNHIPIILESELAKHPDIYYVLAWNFKNEILSNNKNLLQQGIEFYFPVNPL